jgi:hypothetical protein
MPESRRHIRAALVALALGALVLSACGGQTQPREYGEQYEANFMIGCTGVEPNADGVFENPDLGSVPYCECVYDGLVEKVPFEQVEQFEEQQAQEEAGQITVPAPIQAVYDGCAQTNPAPPE